MPRVRIEPAGVVLDLEPGETLFVAARRLGARWPNICGGNGLCRTCWFEVIEGDNNLSPVEAHEASGLRLLVPTLETGRTVRLACQARIQGEMVVRKLGVRAAPSDADPS